MCVLVASSVCKNEMGDITVMERHERGKVREKRNRVAGRGGMAEGEVGSWHR